MRIFRAKVDQLDLSNPNFDAARFEKDMKQPAAERQYCIYFTPRSGSTWLGDTLAQTGVLGRPREWFNQKFVPKALENNNAADLEGYHAMLLRKPNLGGVLAIEITHNQILRVFGSEERFHKLVPVSTPAFWLIREDIVQQAISLAKAAKTAVFHSAHATGEAVSSADQVFEYDAKEISRRVEHLHQQERAAEAMFAQHGITPLRLTYEGITGAGAEATARQFLRVLCPETAETMPLPAFANNYQKIGSSKNLDFAERFRKDCPDVVDKVLSFRAGLETQRTAV